MRAFAGLLLVFLCVAGLAAGCGGGNGPAWGGYNGATAADDAAFAHLVDATPMYATSYYQADQTGVDPLESERIDTGITPSISVATKNFHGGFMRWADIADGRYDPFWRSWGRSLAALDHAVLFTVDQEPEVRLDQHLIPPQNPADYARAYRHVHDLIAPMAPKVDWSFWVAGSDLSKISAMYPGDQYVDQIGWDAYKWAWHPATETPIQTWGPFAHWLNKQPWGHGKPRCIFETGVDVQHFGAANAAAWWSQTPTAAKALGLKFFVLFNRQQWVITGHPEVVAAYSRAVRSL